MRGSPAATLASSALYEQLLEEPFDALDLQTAIERWPDEDTTERWLAESFDLPVLMERARVEVHAKAVTTNQLTKQLTELRACWPALRQQLKAQLMPHDELWQHLHDAGCPTSASEIGVDHHRLRCSYVQAYCIRRRFTVLDLAMRTGLLNEALDRIFSSTGRFPA